MGFDWGTRVGFTDGLGTPHRSNSWASWRSPLWIVLIRLRRDGRHNRMVISGRRSKRGAKTSGAKTD